MPTKIIEMIVNWIYLSGETGNDLLYWRASYEELYNEELVEGNPDTWDDNTQLQWDPKTQSELLLKCSRISASAPKTLSNQQPCQSPLGLQLASLPCLTKLTLELADCFDVSWTWLLWKSSLEELHLFHCDQVSITVLYSFTKLFACTLVTLRLHHVPAHYTVSFNNDCTLQDILSRKLVVKLPKLNNLSVSNGLPVGFLRAFHVSKNLSKISLREYPKLRQTDVTAWLKDKVWPNLKEFNICHTNGFGSIHTLTQLAAKHGVMMCLNGNTGELDDHGNVDSREEGLSESNDEDTGKGDLEILHEIKNENTDGVKNKKHVNIKHDNHDDDTPEHIQDVMEMWTHVSDYKEEVEISDPRGRNSHLSDSILLKGNVI
ncbi:uncharacterized protein MELLADRAFT_112236 [Melampsora larici-populina 98AG31]|uniref:Uncharacterized protein n=1 Tax=Melampsora larici-populina (strain 98AG31 / pathotype 3-4-7) TaxID=747676 RepID=F4S5T6_MELLP|nr:uncharacterized protein MELLADRAFT_112236 [Melampsora larici-populina 98AG31]EGF99954.1 hypothetical protein MELLADRAFT_112236 [Melampsora larici-populina 98AG31]